MLPNAVSLATPPDNSRRTCIIAPLVLDGSGRRFAPGAILLEGNRVVAVGSPQDIGLPQAGAKSGGQSDASGHSPAITHFSDRVFIPALVNTHAHLDLTHIGPRPFDGAFTNWIRMIIRERAQEAQAIAGSVRKGAELARVGGTGLIGDIAGIGSTAAVDALRESQLSGVSYVELFGLDHSAHIAESWMKQAIETCPANDRGVRMGLQPHAPYTCSPNVYGASLECAMECGLPLSTHLAETLEELQFIHSGDGPMADRLLELGFLPPDFRPESVARHAHPVDALATILSRAPFVVAHMNYINDAHLELLASWPITVAYCPRASAYFMHHAEGNSTHRYREMLDVGINVALGTDSIICLDTPDRISILDEMRFLHQRDGTDPITLLRMATINGARGLGFDPGLVTFDEGPIVGVLGLRFDPNASTDPLVQVLERDDAPEWIAGPFAL